MSYRTILAVLGSESTAKSVLPFAVKAAQSQGAHLIGLHAIPASPVHPSFGYEIPSDVWQRARTHAEAIAEAIGTQFTKAVSAEASMESEWRVEVSATNDVSDKIFEHARCADLTMIGQVDLDHRDGVDPELPGTLILEAGRPVLVVPYATSARTIGERVFIAWNGSRESARAVFDALPFLKTAKEVRIYGVNQDEGNAERPLMPGAELAITLARHGVSVTVDHAAAVKHGAAEDMLSRIADHGSDLLVMGGYGHSRARERIFGGVTRSILQAMTVPVLLSN